MSTMKLQVKPGESKTRHLVTPPYKDRHRPRIRALLNDQHLIPRRSECHLAYETRPAELVGREVFEPGYDTAVGRDSDEL